MTRMTFNIKSVLSTAGYVAAALIFQRLAAFGMIFFAVQKLSQQDFGTLTYAYATATTLAAFFGDVFASAVLKYIEPNGKDFRSVFEKKMVSDFFWCAFSCSCVVSLMVFGLLTLNLDSGRIDHSAPASLIALLVILNTTFFSIFSRGGALKLGTCASLFGSFFIILSSGISPHGLSSTFFLWMVVFGFSISALAYMIFSRHLLGLKISRPDIKFSTIRNEKFHYLWKTGAALGLGGPVHWVCISMLLSSDNGTVEMAIFSAWFQWFLILTFIPSICIYFTLPWLAAGYKTSYKKMLSRFAFLISVFVIFGLVFMVTIYANADFIIGFYQKGYAQARYEFYLAIFSGIIACLVVIASHSFMASAKMTENLSITLLYSLSYVSLTFLFVKHLNLGALGIFLALSTSLFLQLVVQFITLFGILPRRNKA